MRITCSTVLCRNIGHQLQFLSKLYEYKVSCGIFRPKFGVLIHENDDIQLQSNSRLVEVKERFALKDGKFVA
jgi:hypothetical protein